MACHQRVSKAHMITQKLSGFGSLGVSVHDVDLQSCGEDETTRLGYLCLEQMVVLAPRSCGEITLPRMHQICSSWALELPTGGYDASPFTFARYGDEYLRTGKKPSELTDDEFVMLQEVLRFIGGCDNMRGMCRVTGMKDTEGNSTGMFSDGELGWHSNQQGTTHIGASVALRGWEGTAGTTTEFLNTVDAYEDLPAHLRSVCDELIAVHHWEKGVMAPGISAIQDHLLSLNMCPQEGTELPLVTWSPGGLKGLHFAFSTISHFKGMGRDESKKILDELCKHVLRDKYVYAHHWQDGDLLFFDNTVTLHRRPTKDCSTRLMHRMAANYDRLLQLQGVTPWNILDPPLKQPLSRRE
jgi:alpha-ketoglutarate-dependent taurine dioxygenase